MTLGWPFSPIFNFMPSQNIISFTLLRYPQNTRNNMPRIKKEVKRAKKELELQITNHASLYLSLFVTVSKWHHYSRILWPRGTCFLRATPGLCFKLPSITFIFMLVTNKPRHTNPSLLVHPHKADIRKVLFTLLGGQYNLMVKNSSSQSDNLGSNSSNNLGPVTEPPFLMYKMRVYNKAYLMRTRLGNLFKRLSTVLDTDSSIFSLWDSEAEHSYHKGQQSPTDPNTWNHSVCISGLLHGAILLPKRYKARREKRVHIFCLWGNSSPILYSCLFPLNCRGWTPGTYIPQYTNSRISG